MNKAFTFFSTSALMALLIIGPFYARAQTSALKKVTGLMSSGDWREFGSLIDETVELTIADDEGAYSPDQAIVILKDFLSQNQPKGFEIKHSGKSKDGETYYGIGILRTSGGSYETYIYIRQVGEKLILQELRLEEA